MPNATLITPDASVLYLGGGGSPVDNRLQVKTTSATLVASGAQVLATGECDVLDLWLMNTTAAQSCKVVVAEFSALSGAGLPTVGSATRVREVNIPTTDASMTADQSAWGLATATEKAPKDHVQVPVRRRAFVMIGLQSSLGGVWYARVTGRKSAEGDASADSGMVDSVVDLVAGGTALTTLATAAKQPSLGTAGTPSANVISVQGVAQGTTIPVTEASAAAIVIALGTLATEATLAGLDGKVVACDTGDVTVAASALPAGAATETTLAALDGKVTACNTGDVTVAVSALPAGAATETTLAALDGKVTACNTGDVTVAVSALPAGAATETTLAAMKGSQVVTAVAGGRAALTGAAQELALGATYTHITLWLDDGSATTYVRMADAASDATTDDPLMAAGDVLHIPAQGAALATGRSAVRILATGATGTINWRAWN